LSICSSNPYCFHSLFSAVFGRPSIVRSSEPAVVVVVVVVYLHEK